MTDAEPISYCPHALQKLYLKVIFLTDNALIFLYKCRELFLRITVVECRAIRVPLKAGKFERRTDLHFVNTAKNKMDQGLIKHTQLYENDFFMCL